VVLDGIVLGVANCVELDCTDLRSKCLVMDTKGLGDKLWATGLYRFVCQTV
jgi:hypothetical protein